MWSHFTNLNEQCAGTARSIEFGVDPVSVVLRDGIRISLEDGRSVVADASQPDGDSNLLSHAHGDHLYSTPPAQIVASELTLDLATVRRDGMSRPERVQPPDIEVLEAGHVPGSSAFLIDREKRYLYTGDLSTRDRFGMSGFEPVDADVLIIESTYGKPTYRFPEQAAVEAEILDWLEETAGDPVILMGYALGRAQELIQLAERAGRDRIFVTEAIEALNEPIQASGVAEFRTDRYDRSVDLEPGDALVLPSQTNSLGFVEQIRSESGALKAGFSGWAIEDSYRFVRDVDVAFPLSDHCDFDELLAVVSAVDPDQVYTVHGFVDEFATTVRSELGVPAQALKRGQATLGDF